VLNQIVDLNIYMKDRGSGRGGGDKFGERRGVTRGDDSRDEDTESSERSDKGGRGEDIRREVSSFTSRHQDETRPPHGFSKVSVTTITCDREGATLNIVSKPKHALKLGQC